MRSEAGSGRVGTALWLALGMAGSAAPPTLDALLPAGGQAGGGEYELTAVGKADPWPTGIWCGNPGVKFEPAEKAGVFKVSIAPDAQPGPCWVRTHNAEGVSGPRIFVVSRMREIVEDSSVANNGPGEATPVGALPVVVNGRYDRSDDVDAWSMELKKGQTLRVRLDSYSLRAGTDPFLHLYDPDGVRVALASDSARHLDPRLSYPIDRDGTWVVATMAIASPPNANVTFHGAGGAVWRMMLSTDPVPRDQSGVDEGETASPEDTLPPEDSEPGIAPIEGFGTLGEPGESDRVRFSAKAGQSLLVKVDAVDFGFSTDPVLTVEKDDGGVIREVDDGKQDRDAEYLFKAPADGVYAARVADRYRRGGEGMRYRLSVAEPVPDFSAVSDKSALTVKSGESVSVKVTVTRGNGHVQPLELSLERTPPGVAVKPVTLDAKATTGELKLDIAAEAKAHSGPITVLVREVAASEGGESRSREAGFSFQDSNARGPYLIDHISPLWLTITPDAKKKD